MNRLAIIAASGVLALLLTACGDNDTTKPVDSTVDTTTEQVQQPNVDAGKTDNDTVQPSTEVQGQ